MAGNLAQVLATIATLHRKGDLDAVRDAVKDQRTRLKKMVSMPRFLTDAVKAALAEGNTQAMIDANKEMYDYDDVPAYDRLTAEKWFNAPKPSASASTRSAYNMWRVWNVAKTQLGVFRKEYKGGRIVEKATGKFVLSPRGYESEDSHKSWSDKGEASTEEEEEELTVAMAAVRVE
jgi:hypothetical protein